MVWRVLRGRVAGPGAPRQWNPGFRFSGAALRYASATRRSRLLLANEASLQYAYCQGPKHWLGRTDRPDHTFTKGENLPCCA